jgi:hypothetical protein
MARTFIVRVYPEFLISLIAPLQDKHLLRRHEATRGARYVEERRLFAHEAGSGGTEASISWDL